MCEFRRGHLYFADLGNGVGSEQEGWRPVLVLQNDIGNKYSPTIIVTLLTAKKKNNMPTHVEISQEFGLEKTSIAMLEQIRTIDKQRITEFIGKLNTKKMNEVNEALKISLSMF